MAYIICKNKWNSRLSYIVLLLYLFNFFESINKRQFWMEECEGRQCVNEFDVAESRPCVDVDRWILTNIYIYINKTLINILNS